MAILAAILATVLLTFTAAIPISIWHRKKTQEAFENDLLAFKLRSIRRHYPELRTLSYDDILSDYDIDHAYFNIH